MAYAIAGVVNENDFETDLSQTCDKELQHIDGLLVLSYPGDCHAVARKQKCTTLQRFTHPIQALPRVQRAWNQPKLSNTTILEDVYEFLLSAIYGKDALKEELVRPF